MSKLYRTLSIALASGTLVAGLAGQAFAVAGACVNCHTMHNSQNGAPMTFDNSAEPKGALLRGGDCIGCHSDATDMPVQTPGSNAPIVFTTGGSAPTNFLAGGNFYWVNQSGGSAYGHNVGLAGIAADASLGNTPPGFDSNYRSSASDWDNNQLSCAGIYGCHGDKTKLDPINSLEGAHHSNASGNVSGATVGASYRFLKGIKGIEDADWEYETDSNHNVYKGSNGASTSNSDTISYLCGTCHGKFHTDTNGAGGVATASPFKRHPTDYLLPQTGEYGNYDPTSTYVNKAPVGYTTPASPTRATAVVLCVSCHRAHGGGSGSSGYADILRFDYATQIAGGGAADGCLTCHNTKD